MYLAAASQYGLAIRTSNLPLTKTYCYKAKREDVESLGDLSLLTSPTTPTTRFG